MIAAKSTPGPWMSVGATVYALMIDGWCNGKQNQCNRFTARVYVDRRAPEEEAIANARLIAAAPALLEALRAFVEPRYTSSNDNDAALIANGRAAIAAATGE